MFEQMHFRSVRGHFVEPIAVTAGPSCEWISKRGGEHTSVY